MKSTLCLLLIAFAGIVAAQETVAQYVNDNKVLNYALTLENFEAALYDYGRTTFTSDSQYTAVGFPAGSKAAIDAIGVVERTHATQLTALLGSRGYPAVGPCQYNFGSITTPLQYVQTLATVELTGTGAYDGAAKALTNKGLLQVAAGIATVEARHTAIIEVILNATNGGFAPVDANAKTVTYDFNTVVSKVAAFFNFATCPTSTLVTQYDGTVSVNSNNTASYQWVSANSLRAQGSAISTNATIGANDLAVLNYALALENLESTFYSTYANLYNVTNVMAAGFNFTAASLISANIGAIATHEAAHVAFLTSQFPTGFTAGTVCNYNVGLNVNTSSFTDFLKVSVQLENTGVAAYVGAIGFLGNSDLTTVAASIATVEGNHAAYVANVLSQLPTAPAVVSQLVANTAGSGTTGNIAAFTVDGGATPTAVEGSVVGTVGSGKFIQCSSTSLLGNPAPISANSPVDFFNDQAQVNPFPATTTTSNNNNNNNGPNTSTTPGSASAVFVSVFVMLIAALF